MRKNAAYNAWWAPVSEYIWGEEKGLFYKTKKSLEEYEAHAIRPDTLVQLMQKKAWSEKIGCPEVVLRPILVYVDGLFLMVHTAWAVGITSDISNHYFGLLDNVAEFFMHIHQKFPDQMDLLKEEMLKIILIFNTWDKILAKDQRYAPYQRGVYYQLSQQYFRAFYTEKTRGSYEKWLQVIYKNCAKTIRIACLQPILAQLGEENSSLGERDVRLFAPRQESEIAEPLVKYKSA